MVTYLTDSEGCCSVSKTHIEQAWDLFTVLMNLGRPSRLEELAEKNQVSPDFVKFLCSIPNSPLFLTEDLCVTVSLASFTSSRGCAFDKILKFIPKITVRVSGSKRLMGDFQTYFRKRKRQRVDKPSLNSSKRILISSPECDEDDQTRLALAESILSVSSSKDLVEFANKLIRDLSFLQGSVTTDLETSTEDAVPSFFFDDNLDSTNHGFKKIKDEEKTEAEKNVSVQELPESVSLPDCRHSLFNNTKIDLSISEIAEKDTRFCDVGLNLQFSTVETKVVCEETHLDQMDFRETAGHSALICVEESAKRDNLPVENDLSLSQDCEPPKSRELKNQAKESCEKGQIPGALGGVQGDANDNTAKALQVRENRKGSVVSVNCNDAVTSLARDETHLDQMDFREATGQSALICVEEPDKCDNLPVENDRSLSHDCEALKSRELKNQAKDSCEKGQIIIKPGAMRGQGDVTLADNTSKPPQVLENHPGSMVSVNWNDAVTSPAREEINGYVDRCAVCPSIEAFTTKMQSPVSSPKLVAKHKDTTLNCSNVANSNKPEESCKGDQKSMNVKQNCKRSLLANEKPAEPPSITLKSQSESNALPNFESFIIEEEEGSGGYGTVYRARRKSDGKTFAIKSPHVNAHVHHVTNEMKMLEQFGGKNFVIKYEGSFKNNNSDCFVLEHVEHDRPEVLKKEINMFELRWYGYCMFRALASLHKQGIVHRDIKPGNFLFSRKRSKGYLIDFNLAMDLHQKYNTTSKSKMSATASFDRVTLPSSKAIAPIKGRKVTSSRFLGACNQEISMDSRQSLESRSMKKVADVGHSKAYVDLRSRHNFKSQGGDGSGITSTRDATSTRTPSGETQREPLPSRGRKEYMNLLQEVMRSSNQNGISFPASQRKRVVATPGKVDKKFVYPTPMPLLSAGSAVAGAALYKSKGDGKQKKEGPCVGTKGFRAPEILLKSPHQGPKVDVWSAGVTLLYLMIGRSPFLGDPEQNIKDIAKLRGSEDLWEVAKLHDRESSFPVELFDIQSLPATELREWCKTNTKRPEFFDMIPRSLFNLVDKCLTVNPRLRISAEEALNHEFFASCHESLRKHRLLRQEPRIDSENANLSHQKTQVGS